ncbi:hypothetical protein SAMD00019534_020100 [Acytostelium subglobosum LB1]|uniref:hypothetical protein n=1 Tax=Acytostelium subglobosum LB1 TaxID=1410327 RepID=UPI000644F014|nr:hypothetical protein SAMD00019534_020100 [Acytostelium subglobosum LB1]GAM18835.1 hypothetical protein SAMD00019534_020100 [Acytostelium subglobosum LB1]|eukprot:XP_012758055.1 hypothetical protein SAMD00019534_020100 [Acytostelium subglobosum LB1]
MYEQQQQQQQLMAQQQLMSPEAQLININLDAAMSQEDFCEMGTELSPLSYDSSPRQIYYSDASTDECSSQSSEPEQMSESEPESEAEAEIEVKQEAIHVPRKKTTNKSIVVKKENTASRKKKAVPTAKSEKTKVAENRSDKEMRISLVRYPKVIIQKGCGRFVFKIKGKANPKNLKLMTVVNQQLHFELDAGMSSVKEDGVSTQDPTFSRFLNNSDAKSFTTTTYVYDTRTMTQLCHIVSPTIRFYYNTNDLPAPKIEDIKSVAVKGNKTELRIVLDRLKMGTTKMFTLFVNYFDETNKIRVAKVVDQKNIQQGKDDSDCALFELDNMYLNDKYRLYAAYTYNPANDNKKRSNKDEATKGKGKKAKAPAKAKKVQEEKDDKKKNANYKEKNCIRYEGELDSLVGKYWVDLWTKPVNAKEDLEVRWQSLNLSKSDVSCVESSSVQPPIRVAAPTVKPTRSVPVSIKSGSNHYQTVESAPMQSYIHHATAMC